jgi:N-sulfoglucosamine sulfohydrolase
MRKTINFNLIIKIHLGLAVMLFMVSCTIGEKDSKSSKPLNVLLITADDLNYNSIGSYGNTIPNITPNIDRLAKQGMRFSHAYMNIAVCQPSRQSFMTGRYPHNNGAPGFDPIDRDVPTLQEELNKVGYLNGVIGKEEHLKPMDKFYWDFCIREEDVASGLGIGRDPELYYKYALDFFSRAKQDNKPFFLTANSHDPHRPFADSDEEKKYWGDDLPKFSRRINEEEVTIPGFLFDLPEVRKELAEYYTSVHRCDETVGAILKALDDSGFSDNTIVMFVSDNGMAVPFAKSNCYLNSNKTPWIVRWPGQVQAGKIDSTHFISGIDYMPTILHALHLSKVRNMDGYSFLPILKGEQQKQRTEVFTEFNKIFAGIEYPMRSIQDKKYGYIVNFWADGEKQIRGDAMGGRTFKAMNEAALSNKAIAERVELYKYRVPEELYDFEKDPDGLVNLIDKPELQDELKKLKELLYKEMKRTDDPWQHDFKEKFMP